MRCYWECLMEHIMILGNTLGTSWKLDGNIVGAHGEQTKNKESPTHLKKREKTKQLNLSIGCMIF